MICVAFDPDDKNVVRGVYEAPEGWSFEDAANFIQAAYAKAAEDEDNDGPVDTIEAEGFKSVIWQAVEVS